MAETSDQILEHIEAQRASIQSDVAELESRVRDATDIRKQFERQPILLPLAVIGVSLLLAAIFRRR